MLSETPRLNEVHPALVIGLHRGLSWNQFLLLLAWVPILPMTGPVVAFRLAAFGADLVFVCSGHSGGIKFYFLI